MTTATEAIQQLNSLISLPDTSGTATGAEANQGMSKAAVLAYMAAAGYPATTFEVGDPGERIPEVMGRALAAFSVVPAQAVRAVFFALSTDPGDVDDFGNPDQSADQTPRPGFLSAYGLSFAGVERRGQTRATCFVTIQNTGATPTAPFKAGQLAFEQSGASRSDGGKPTYTSTADPSIYTGIGDTLTLAPSATATIPVAADQLGAYGSAPLNDIDVCITQSFGTLVVTASTVAIGEEREDRAAYIARCLVSADKLAPGGPTQAFRFAMNTARDGTPLQRYDGSGPVTITDAYISADSTDGEVTIYYSGPSGAVIDLDRDSANANILGLQLLDPVSGEDHNPNPVGCVPDTVAILPLIYSGGALPDGTMGGDSCTNTPVFIHYTVKIKASKVVGGATAGTYATPWKHSTVYHVGQKVQNDTTRIYVCTVQGTSAGSGGPTGTGSGITDGGVTWNYSAPATANTNNTRAIFNTNEDALADYLLSTGVGGLDQTSGAGVVYTADLPGVVRDAVAGEYDPVVSLPSTSSTAILLGHIAVAGTITGVLTVVSG